MIKVSPSPYKVNVQTCVYHPDSIVAIKYIYFSGEIYLGTVRVNFNISKCNPLSLKPCVHYDTIIKFDTY